MSKVRKYVLNPLLTNKLSSIALAACMMVSPVAAIADDSAPAEPTIVGFWIVLVGVGSPTPTYNMSTFLPGGQVISDDNQTTLHSAFQGEWMKIGPGQYLRSMRSIRFDSAHTFTGFGHLINLIQLNDAGDEYDAEGIAEIYDVNGNLTTTSVNAQHARRCTAAMTMPQCMGLAPLTKSSD